MLFCFFKYLIIAIIAAGVTPDILEAAPNVGGCILINFSTISLERLPTSLKFVVFGIIKPSSFLKSSISALCLSK